VLEQKIRERRQTFEEFITYVERFRREHHEPGTLSLRHLERLVAGHRGDGHPLGPVRPATARLLEHILGLSITELLAPPTAEGRPPLPLSEPKRIDSLDQPLAKPDPQVATESPARTGGRSSRHVHCAASLSSRKRMSFVPCRKRFDCTLS